MKTNQNGFTSLSVIAAVIIVLIIAGTGIWFYNQNSGLKPVSQPNTPPEQNEPVTDSALPEVQTVEEGQTVTSSNEQNLSASPDNNIVSMPEDEKITLLASVKGCAESLQEVATKTVGEGIEQNPTIIALGNEIRYFRAINHLCGRKVEIEKEKIGNTINIYEIWSGMGAKCQCFSTIGAIISNVPSGNYTINVYEKGTEPGTGNAPMPQNLIISQSLAIR